jgi:hypothetical protein
MDDKRSVALLQKSMMRGLELIRTDTLTRSCVRARCGFKALR